MRPAYLATLAMALYAIQNILVEQKLSRYHTSVFLLCTYPIALLLTAARWGTLRVSGTTMEFPTGAMLTLTVVTGAIYFTADYCYLAAYARGGSVMTITTIVILLPIFCSIVKFAWVRELPNGYQVAGYIAAVVAIFLVAKGDAPP